MSTVVIAAMGTRGDVVPLVGLGDRLQRAGHRVAVATAEAFRGLVEPAGLEFRQLPGDPEGSAQSEAYKQYFEKGHSSRTLKELVPSMVEDLRRMARPLRSIFAGRSTRWPAARGRSGSRPAGGAARAFAAITGASKRPPASASGSFVSLPTALGVCTENFD